MKSQPLNKNNMKNLKSTKFFEVNLFYFALCILILLNSGCSTNQTSTEKDPTDSLGLVNDSMGKLYAWTNPVPIATFLDHTWVTTTNLVENCPPSPDFWYCWGVCHMTHPNNPNAQAIGNQEANIVLANCIATSNDSRINVNTHAGITGFYGFRGVCHQVANRVLYATASLTSPPLTVDGSKGYALSHFLYGTYGRGLDKDFKRRIKKCGGNPAFIEKDMKFEELLFKNNLKEDYNQDLMDTLITLRNEMHRFMDNLEKPVIKKQMTIVQYCNAVNNKLTDIFQNRLQKILDKNSYQRIFNLETNAPVVALDLEIARLEDAQR